LRRETTDTSPPSFRTQAQTSTPEQAKAQQNDAWHTQTFSHSPRMPCESHDHGTSVCFSSDNTISDLGLDSFQIYRFASTLSKIILSVRHCKKRQKHSKKGVSGDGERWENGEGRERRCVKEAAGEWHVQKSGCIEGRRMRQTSRHPRRSCT
jgi:hypothetical protein